VLGAEGKGLGQREDDFHYVYQRAAGNFRLKARLTGWNGAGRESRVGLMVRESLEPNAYHASVSLRDSGEGLRHEFLRRSSNFTRTFAHETYDSADLWLELEREGDAVRGRLSTDGENWTEADDAVFEGFPDEVFVGVAAAASENDFGIASFCDVQLVEG
jgi:regulation of enolase protein 1 (concanavalin A-like superfamily)